MDIYQDAGYFWDVAPPSFFLTDESVTALSRV
jgi:hypothetical protein